MSRIWHNRGRVVSAVIGMLHSTGTPVSEPTHWHHEQHDGKIMSLSTLVLKPVDLLIHAAKKQSAATTEVSLEREWLDDHEFSFAEVGRSINGLPIRKTSSKDCD